MMYHFIGNVVLHSTSLYVIMFVDVKELLNEFILKFPF